MKVIFTSFQPSDWRYTCRYSCLYWTGGKLKATNWGKLLCLGPQVVPLIISLLGHFSLWNLIEIPTGSEINEDLHDCVGISLGTPVGGLNIYHQWGLLWSPVMLNCMICLFMLGYLREMNYLTGRGTSKSMGDHKILGTFYGRITKSIFRMMLRFGVSSLV